MHSRRRIGLNVKNNIGHMSPLPLRALHHFHIYIVDHRPTTHWSNEFVDEASNFLFEFQDLILVSSWVVTNSIRCDRISFCVVKKIKNRSNPDSHTDRNSLKMRLLIFLFSRNINKASEKFGRGLRCKICFFVKKKCYRYLKLSIFILRKNFGRGLNPKTLLLPTALNAKPQW